MLGQPRSIADVVAGGLCTGCGACAYMQPDEIRMIDFPNQGIRPVSMAGDGSPIPLGPGLDVCPGIALGHDGFENEEELVSELLPGWGPVLSMWEGYASDAELRHAGSSGGAASALGLYALEVLEYCGVLHIGANPDIPYLNRTAFSQTRADLLSRTGSRYAPANPCEGLGRVEQASRPCALIAKPCDIAAAQKARRLRPNLDANLGITVAFFCAGTPSTAGTFAMLRKMGVTDVQKLRTLRYRGNGWPGKATAVFVNEQDNVARTELSYEESWGQVLTKHVQWRCRLCADHTGEFADIAVGDPWYRAIEPGESGSSLVIARTQKGRQFIEGAISAGFLTAEQARADILPRSQPNLLKGRGAVWGRILGLRLIGAAAPRYSNMRLFQFWWSELTTRKKIKSVLGTIRRCLQRGYHPWTR